MWCYRRRRPGFDRLETSAISSVVWFDGLAEVSVWVVLIVFVAARVVVATPVVVFLLVVV